MEKALAEGGLGLPGPAAQVCGSREAFSGVANLGASPHNGVPSLESHAAAPPAGRSSMGCPAGVSVSSRAGPCAAPELLPNKALELTGRRLGLPWLPAAGRRTRRDG